MGIHHMPYGGQWGNCISEDDISHRVPNPQTFLLAFRDNSVGQFIPNIE